jgi:hypothetical protein
MLVSLSCREWAVTLERQSNQSAHRQKASFAQGHAAQAFRTHRPGSFAPLMFAQPSPSAKPPMPLPTHKAIMFSPLLAEAVCRREEKQELRVKKQVKKLEKNTSGQSKGAVAQTQKRGRVVDLCGGAFLRLDLLVFGSSQK